MAGKAKISVDDSGVWVTTRSDPPEGRGGFLLIWLTGWTLGELAVIVGLLFGHQDSKGFLVLWLFGWTIAGAFVWYMYLWPRIGYTVLEIDDRTLRIRNVLGPVNLKREYDRAKISHLHGSESNIAFEYEGKKRWYGEDVSREDLTAIVAAVRQRFPDICSEPQKPKEKGKAAR